MITTLKRSATAQWEGSGLEGTGSLTTRSSALDKIPYSHKTRFKNEEGTEGTNPEELLAAAHAGCFNMALSFQLGASGYVPKLLNTKASIEMSQQGFDYYISKISLQLEGDVPDITHDEFSKLANKAKESCPISQALASVEIVLTVALK
jgi:osmotically inducible protein OsmC